MGLSAACSSAPPTPSDPPQRGEQRGNAYALPERAHVHLMGNAAVNICIGSSLLVVDRAVVVAQRLIELDAIDNLHTM